MAAKTSGKAARATATTKTAAKSSDVAEKKPENAASDAARTEGTKSKSSVQENTKTRARAKSQAKAPTKARKAKITKVHQQSPTTPKKRRSAQRPQSTRMGFVAAEAPVMPEMVDRGLSPGVGFGEMVVPPSPRPDPGDHYCLGIVAGSDAPEGPGFRPIGDFATDLCEVAPSGQVAIAGDTFSGDCAVSPGAKWYASLGLHVKPGTLQRKVEFDYKFGWDDDLYDQPHWPGQSQLPAGTVQVRVGGQTRDYALVTRTTSREVDGKTILEPINSRLVVIDPERPHWRTVTDPNSERPADWQWSNQTQISGFQDDDGWVYIVADSFSRDKPVVLYHCRAETFEDRNTWWAWAAIPDHPELPWAWDQPNVRPTQLSDDLFGELSLRKIQGKYVLSGFNATTSQVEVRVADDVTQVLAGPRDDYKGTPVTVVVNQDELPHCYGGYIAPGSTLDEARILVSQWGSGDTAETKNYPYTVREYVVNLNRR